MRTVSLFSGCGGSDLGAIQAGAEIVFANDNWKVAGDTYRHNLPVAEGVFRDGDIRDHRDFPSAQLVMGSYPCQTFTMGGPRSPAGDSRTTLYLEFARALEAVQPEYFVAENVPGLRWLAQGSFFREHFTALATAGEGYEVSSTIVNARDFGVPADRRRLFLVGVRRDLKRSYKFPEPTHGSEGQPYTSHGDAISSEPLNPGLDDYYSYQKPSDWWWYMSRNRKRPWHMPSFTIVANWRHIPLHPASPSMSLVSSDLKNGWRQEWEFGTHDHLTSGDDRPKLDEPRRMTWRECAILQTFPTDFDVLGKTEAKFRQIGNAVPPTLMKVVVQGLVSGEGLTEVAAQRAGRKQVRSV